jgi:hypothetical protein
MQYDAAVDPVIAKTKMKGVDSKVAGKVITALLVKLVLTSLQTNHPKAVEMLIARIFVHMFPPDLLGTEKDNYVYVSSLSVEQLCNYCAFFILYLECQALSSNLLKCIVFVQATVLIFPDLNTGNNTYKAVQQVFSSALSCPTI